MDEIAIAIAKRNRPSSEQVTSAVNDWLDDHPEATTTVQDGSISYAKLATDMKQTVDNFEELVIVSGTEPQEDGNKLWIEDAPDSEYSIPTYAEFSALADAKQDAPAAAGTAGQVLGLDSNLDPVWVNQQGGGGGGTSDYSDLTNKPQINGVTLAGNKSLADLGAAAAADVSAKYTKPAGGVPKTDLASDVQASLGKADTALQGSDVAEAVGDWLETNITNPDSPPLDRSLSVTAAAAPADLVGDLKNKIDTTRSKMQLITAPNLLSGSTVGYRTANGNYGDSDSYRYTDKIQVEVGDVISLWAVNKAHTTFSAMNSRFTCASDSDGNPVTASGTDSNITSYTVPSGIAYVQFSIAKSYFDSYDLMIVKGASAPTVYQPYFEPYYIATPEFLPRPYKIGNGYENGVKESSTGINIELPSTNIAKNLLYAFSAEIGNDFTNLVIGSGFPNGSYKSYITIDATNLTFNVNGSNYVYPHGLTIADYIKVTIDINDNTKAKVTLTSGGSQFTKTLGWYGFHTDKYAAFSASGTFTNVVFTVAFKDINSNTHIYGDSYVAIVESTSKWSHWLVADGYGKNALINAYPGEDSANALNALQTVLSVGCPKYLLWCLGMNDGGDTDSETPNSAWMAGINKVLSLCEANGIAPILATIPSVPSYNHEAKNAWVRSSGYRYVDFAKAVGANSSGEWFSGMLSTDNIHPSELGAKALWHQVLCDFPEITM